MAITAATARAAGAHTSARSRLPRRSDASTRGVASAKFIRVCGRVRKVAVARRTAAADKLLPVTMAMGGVVATCRCDSRRPDACETHADSSRAVVAVGQPEEPLADPRRAQSQGTRRASEIETTTL